MLPCLRNTEKPSSPAMENKMLFLNLQMIKSNNKINEEVSAYPTKKLNQKSQLTLELLYLFSAFIYMQRQRNSERVHMKKKKSRSYERYF